ncbi:alcohol dehydrogenase catalytic domain-containing protein [Streptomyces sp. NPDC023588]
MSCGHCYPCSVGRPNVCTSLQVIGYRFFGAVAGF